MPATGYSTPSVPVIEWSQNASGGRVTVDDPYQLRELLSRLAIQIDMPDSSGVVPSHVDVGGNINFFKVEPAVANVYGTPLITKIGDASLDSHVNLDWMDREWSDPFTLQPSSWNLFSRIRETYNQYYADANNPQDVDIFLGFDLTGVNLDFGGYASQFTNQYSGLPDSPDVILELSPQFWSRVGEIVSEPSRPSALQVFSAGPAIMDGETLDLGRLAESFSAYDDFSDFIRSNLSITLNTDVSAHALEFGGWTHGSLDFRHEGSGRSISLQLADLDRSWGSGTSELGMVDPIFDDNGNPISTELEFGIGRDNWQLVELLRSAEEAYEADWALGTSTLGSFDGASKWMLSGGRIHTGPAESLTGPGNELAFNALLQDLINSESISFYTRPLGSSLVAQSGEPIEFLISDYQQATFDVADQTSGFILELDGPLLSSLDAVPVYREYWGELVFTPSYDSAFFGVPYSDAGELRINVNRQLDGLARNITTSWSSGNNYNLGNLYPELAESDTSLGYRLSRVMFGADLFDLDAPGGTSSHLEFNIQSDGLVNRNSRGSSVFDSYQSLSQLLPNWALLQNVAVTGLFDSRDSISPLSVELSLLDQPWGSEQSAVGFRYGLRSAASSDILTQLAVLGDSVDESQHYYLDIYGTSLLEGFDINTLDFTVALDTSLFNWFGESDIQIGSALPIANAASIDRENGLVRFAAASLESAGAGRSISSGSEELLASVRLNFNEAQLRTLGKNADGSLSASPFAVSVTANANETVLSKSFNDTDGNLNSDIRTLASLGGAVEVDGQEVTLYDAFINLQQLGAGLVLGTNRQIGADAGFTNLVRQGDKIHASVDWLNVGNIRAEDLSVAQRYNANGHIIVEESIFTRSAINSGSFIDGVYVPDARELTTLNAVVKVTGSAGNVIDVADGLYFVQARGSDQFINDGKGTSNLITFQGDLNYDGRVSMKDLAYLNAGAARQKAIADVPLGVDADGNGFIDSTVAHDVDADFNGRIDLAVLAVLDQDWGKTLHLGDEQFQGSADLSWNDLDIQGPTVSWHNSSFKEQNAIEASPSYVGSLEGPGVSTAIGADGNTSPNDNDMQGAYYQDVL